jgi:PAS domain S-box-containing protein
MSDDIDILIVDDRQADRLAISEVLRGRGYRVMTAATGNEALRRVLENDFAVILLDVMMPDIDGFEVARIIKQRDRSRDTPLIFLTAAGADKSFTYAGYSVGAVDYLGKPIDADVVRAKVGIFADIFRKDRRIKEQAEALREADRREQDRELAAVRSSNEQRYRSLTEAIPHIVWTAGPEGDVTRVNQRWVEYTGSSPADALGAGWMQAIHPSDLATYTEKWRHAVHDSKVFELEFRLRARDGEHRWHLCRAVPEHAPDGTIAGWLGTFTDFDDRKRAYDAANAALAARDEFLSIASHEFRTPLMTLGLRLRSLEHELVRALPAGAEQGSIPKLSSAIRQGDRLVTLVDGLLDVSRISNGSLNLKRERVALVDAANEVVERFAELAANAGCALSVHTEHAGIEGSWDRLRIEQALQNLLGNAIKYGPGAPVEIRISGSDGIATLTMRDHGRGIEDRDAERIFGRFERAVPTRHFGGLGLGLYITRQIAVAHGGNVRVLPTDGDGATFSLTLPMTARE